tara:strand:+ start:4181 stop:4945 length:765 start_codon:yes stop_codon:yes gene_type:complete
MRLKDKVCIITGAAGGQGEVAVEIFAKEGAKILATDINGEPTARLQNALESHPSNIKYVSGDMTEGADLDRVVRETVSSYGHIDVLFNNHGVMVGSPLLETTEEELDLVLMVNVRSSFLLCQKVAKSMVDKGIEGSIILNSSVGGLIGFPDMAAYGASKAGVAQLSRSMANDLRDHKIRVNAVAPGGIDTPMPHKYLEKFEDREAIWKAMEQAHLTGRLGRPEEVIWLVVFLASDEASFMNGSVVTVDGGYSCV